MTMRFVVTPLPVGEDTLSERFKEAASSSANQTTFAAIKSVPVSQITVGPRHVAMLLEDGRIGRASFNVIADRLEFPPPVAQSAPNFSMAPAGPGLNQLGNHPPHLPSQVIYPNSLAAAAAAASQLGSMSKPIATSNAVVIDPRSIPNSMSPTSMGPGLDGRGGSGSTSSAGSGPTGQGTNVGGSSSSAAPGQGVPPFGRISVSQQVTSLNAQHRQAARRGRMLRQTATRGRGATSVIMGSRAVIPAHYVPEDLINQAQNVLQGKPRSAIVRELQRTNLDVNSAVNNLLSSDNEDPEDMDEGQDYLPNDDLMALLDSSVNLPSGPTSVLIDAETVFPEDVFNSYSASRIRPSSLRHSVGGRGNSDRESSLASELEIRRIANRDPSQSRRWLEHALRDPVSDNSNNRMSSATDFTVHHRNDSVQPSCLKKTFNNSEACPIQVSDTVELWPGDKRFIQIASMHSELIAISSSGQIHQWKWSEPLPFDGIRYGDIVNYHPKVSQLNLTHEKVQMLSASCVRATVVTESSKVATWVDDSINVVANKLEHVAQNYPEFQRGDKIIQLQTCSLYSCVRLKSGSIYWWGVAPFSQRKKNWKKIQSKTSKHSSNSSSTNEIGVGSIVCLKNGPSFGDGAIGFTTKDSIPRVGRLVMSAWQITDTCTFKIIQPSDKKGQLSQQPVQLPDIKSANNRSRKMLGQPIDFSSTVSEDQPPTSPGMAKNSSSERLEMPPPPSPASSTCSEPGCSPSHKRKHKHLSKEDDKTRDEEQWNLKDVIFLEEVKKPPAAKVIKLDGNTALVRFNQRDPFGHQADSDVNAYLKDCRMIRKEELQLAKETTSSSKIIDCQRSPKKLNIPDSCNFLAFTVSNSGIHAVVKNGSKIEYKMYQLGSGRPTKSLPFPTDTNAFLGRDPSLIALYASGESEVTVTLRDGNGCMYPLSRDFLDALKEPQPLDMPPVQALGMAIHPVRDTNNPGRINPTLVVAMAFENQILIPAILRSDPEFVRLTLASLETEPVSQQIAASEKIDLNRNILHAAVYSCAPTPSKYVSDKGKFSEECIDMCNPSNVARLVLNENLKRSQGKQSTAQPSPSGSTLDLSSDGDSRSLPSFSQYRGIDASSSFEKFEIEPTETKQAAHIVLLTLIDCPFLRSYLKDLMIQKDAQGMTPFMLAVSSRAYTAAVILFDLAQWLLRQEDLEINNKHKFLTSMIFPTGTSLDNNPLYMLCANDTCSFTWTGAQHINQDIFECKTCGLTRSFCCCSECARTCHKGHDCRLKKTSPTAYCDCWEKCKCKSLVSGSHVSRFKMLEKLLADTDLVTYPDSKGESILLFLVQTVGRQLVEQRQYAPESHRNRLKSREELAEMPEHDLSPPRFARKALHKMLSHWLALKTVIMAGTCCSMNATSSKISANLNTEDQIFLSGQHGTALLDRFTHSVLIKVGPEMLDVLLTTIIRESSSSDPLRVNEASLVAKRFVRSVARNGVVLSVELSPVNYAQPLGMLDISNMMNQVGSGQYNNSPWKPSQQPASILQKCRKVFQALLPIAAEELAEIADALISPVRLGVPRPTAPFSLVNSMAEATQGSEEIFVVEPVVIPGSANIDQSTVVQASSDNQANPAAVTESQAPMSENPQAPSDRMREMLFENAMAIETIDSEDAEASNNTFRPSNNGESDSDSDSNPDDAASFQSNIDPSGARSTATGATAGSEIGASTVAYFSEAESGDSSNADEEDEDSEANDTENDNDDLSFSHDENFTAYRRTQTETQALQHLNLRSTNLGQQLHWALRHRDNSFYPPPTGSALPSTAARLASLGFANAYAYMDGGPTRRSTMPGSSQTVGLATTTNELSMSTTAVGLSRAFSIIIRSIADLIPILRESERSDSALTINQLMMSPVEAATIICNLETKLNPIWEWLSKVMDSTEGQLRFGCALTNGIQAAAQGPSFSSSQSTTSHHRPAGAPTTAGNPLPNSYFPGSAANLLPVHPAMLARVNLSAHNLNRRVPNIFDESANRIQNVSVAPGASASPEASGVRLHNPVQSSVPARPQSLTSRSTIPGYAPRMNDASESIDGASARRDFLSYMISLIRGHGNEHHDSLPIMDVSSLRHVAYVFDAYVYYLQALNRNKLSELSEDWSDEEDLAASLALQRGPKHNFFRRSESTLFLDGRGPDPIRSSLAEALPLAQQPHLLQPNSRREDLFGLNRSTHQTDIDLDTLPTQISLSSPSSSVCSKCISKTQAAKSSGIDTCSSMKTNKTQVLCPLHRVDNKLKSDIQHKELLGKWRLTVELFGREFLDDVGAEPGSILPDLVGFPLKENRFRKDMERLRSENSTKEISLINVDRDKHVLIRQTIKELNTTYHQTERLYSRRNIELPVLACGKVKVSFKDEKGEGNGVARSFYTAFCEAILANERLANFDAPLFYQPGVRNFYSPRQGDASVDRLNAFRNVGRIIGICLSQSEICPIQLNRHVIKYILSRPISWHDLAFFDPYLYESLRQLMVEAQDHPTNNATIQILDLRFCVDLCPEEGGGQAELAAGGKNIEVTPYNIHEYVRRYVLRRMLKSQEKALNAMRQGVMDVLPPSALDNLTAEDFRLLLNGVGEINVQTLIGYTTFIDDRGTTAVGKRNSVQVDEQLSYFKKWFWSIVEKMTTKEKQDLVYFWTGSPSLPASEEGFNPMPTVSIRPAEDLHLPTSNVCIFRLYIPLYSSKAILKSKLLIAIKEKNFGFV